MAMVWAECRGTVPAVEQQGHDPVETIPQHRPKQHQRASQFYHEDQTAQRQEQLSHPGR
eukprot:CAMPEP_0183398120 /NCGR_PEP_ID=MMETSP0370-20130417/11047_1 /TAXON_ID=268820 /ORGANISM="Peridinium aciculiferum, Strain PAER-2" /LENGTH=58 /DNA_ID=CAMNT_0025579099 /DNA_START=66 /DNA_END=243 /DNA_ORIENTATION=+